MNVPQRGDGKLRHEWSPRISRHSVDFALHHPLLAVLLGTGRTSFEEMQRKLVEHDLRVIEQRYNRFTSDGVKVLERPANEQQLLLRRLGPSKREDAHGGLNQWHSFLYAATRDLKPRVVVETGVLYGYSSAAILRALQTNGNGILVSVDLPPNLHAVQVVPERSIQVGLLSQSHNVGSAVPEGLRDRWALNLGNSLAVLPELLRECGPISMFVHDSLHTYEHMIAEYRLGYLALQRGGILISDDVDYNSAWTDFASSLRESRFQLRKGTEGNRFGYLRKTHDATEIEKG